MCSPTETVIKRRILFIINPISGGKNKEHLPDLIQKILDRNRFLFEIYWWKELDQLEGVIADFVAASGDLVVAVGGDGTVNAIAEKLAGSNVLLAAIPYGSGNGLARQLGFLIQPSSFLARLNSGVWGRWEIDAGFCNGNFFVNIAGIGLDARVSHAFAGNTGRGLWNYARIATSAFFKATEFEYEVQTDVDQNSGKALLIDVANGSQWGNDFFISPLSVLDDGILDVVIVKKPGWMQIPSLLRAIKLGRPHALIQHMRAKSVTCTTTGSQYFHVDGEPTGESSHFHFTLLPHKVAFLSI